MFTSKFLNKYLLLGIIGVFFLLSATALPVNAITADVQATDGAITASYPDGPTGYIRVERLNIRSGPGTQYPIVGVAHYQEVVSLTGRNAAITWLQVRQTNGQQGWADASFIVASAAHIAALPILDDIPPTPSPMPPSVDPFGRVTAYRLNVRSGSGRYYDIIGQLNREQVVSLVGRNTASTWLQIRLPNGLEGWVSARYMWSRVPIYTLPVTGGDVPNPSPEPIGYVIVNKLNVRSGPGTHYGIMGWVYRYQRVRVLDRSYDGKWLKVEIAPNYQGWVYARYIQPDIPDPIRGR